MDAMCNSENPVDDSIVVMLRSADVTASSMIGVYGGSELATASSPANLVEVDEFAPTVPVVNKVSSKSSQCVVMRSASSSLSTAPERPSLRCEGSIAAKNACRSCGGGPIGSALELPTTMGAFSDDDVMTPICTDASSERLSRAARPGHASYSKCSCTAEIKSVSFIKIIKKN